jgi:HAD superfamily hydrolase (TIGR01509 family)
MRGADAGLREHRAGPLPTAVVFDCDGTIADTESISDRAWSETLAEHGYTATAEDFRAVIGYPFPQNWAYFSARADLGERDAFRARLRARFLDLFDRELEVHDDAVSTIVALGAAGVPIGVASSSSHQHVERVLARAGVTDLVGAIVGADDVEAHKPAPEPYLAAAAGLGVDPLVCSAVEDTPVGLAAALAAGMFTVGVVRTHATADDLADAHRVVDHLSLAALVPDPVRVQEGDPWS